MKASASPTRKAAKVAPKGQRAAPNASTKSKSAKKVAAEGKLAVSKGVPVESASLLIDGRIRELVGWRGEALARMRALILEAIPEVTEQWKWTTPVWSHHGIICTGEAYKKSVKLTFARGASVPDPAHLFNSSLEGNVRRAIDIHEGEQVDARAFKLLVKAAANHNRSVAKKA